LLARVVQHETDHLDGVLFVDRLSPTKRVTIKETLDEFETVFDDRRRVGEFPDDATVAARLEELERLRC
jgi:peptide deformylase